MNKIKTSLARIAFSIERAFWYLIYLVRYLWRRFILREGVLFVYTGKDSFKINDNAKFDKNGGEFKVLWKRKKGEYYLYYIQRL